jgi:DNA-directed RNA polymerase specialized sigma24 family protein
MARLDWVEARLQRWAEACTVGDGSGYATLSVLHPNWSPPGGGQSPTMKVARASDVVDTMRAVDQLSLKLHQAVVVHYCKRGSIERQCDELDCSKTTLFARIEAAHVSLAALLGRGFCNKDESV